jgi:hypothetical protein
MTPFDLKFLLFLTFLRFRLKQKFPQYLKCL